MRKKNAKKIAVAATDYVVGKTPYVGSPLSADIYSKEINSEITK